MNSKSSRFPSKRYRAVPAPPSIFSARCSMVECGKRGEAPNIAGGTVSLRLTVMRENEFQRSYARSAGASQRAFFIFARKPQIVCVFGIAHKKETLSHS